MKNGVKTELVDFIKKSLQILYNFEFANVMMFKVEYNVLDFHP